MANSLCTEVSIQTRDGITRQRNALVHIEHMPRRSTVELACSDKTITVQLTNGERIALIEALGGHV